MKQQCQETPTHRGRPTNPTISRRSALNASGFALLASLSGSAFAQAEKPESPANNRPASQRLEGFQGLAERLRNAGSNEERQQIMNEQMGQQRQTTIDHIRDQLRISDQEWGVIQPRFMAVYDLVRPAVQATGRNEASKTELEQKTRDLAALLKANKPDTEQLKAKLAAYRAAKAKADQELVVARQNLRQIMNLRQEAVLVLNGLLD
jgi:hypothetical protein